MSSVEALLTLGGLSLRPGLAAIPSEIPSFSAFLTQFYQGVRWHAKTFHAQINVQKWRQSEPQRDQ